jgi:hypothetical protein
MMVADAADNEDVADDEDVAPEDWLLQGPLGGLTPQFSC